MIHPSFINALRVFAGNNLSRGGGLEQILFFSGVC